MHTKTIGFLTLLLWTSSICGASPITYTFSGTGSGTLGGTSFQNAAFTFSLNGDTSAVQDLEQVWANSISGSFSISGVGPGTISDAFVFGLQSTFLVGLEADEVSGVATLVGVGALPAYDLQSPYTYTVLPFFDMDRPNSLATSEGDLVMSGLSGLAFQATVSDAPEPATWTAMGAGLGLLAFLRKGQPLTGPGNSRETGKP